MVNLVITMKTARASHGEVTNYIKFPLVVTIVISCTKQRYNKISIWVLNEV